MTPQKSGFSRDSQNIDLNQNHRTERGDFKQNSQQIRIRSY